MNDKTKVYYRLTRMYEYARDICTICERKDFDYENVIEDMVSKHAVNMCIVQLGEFANQIKQVDEQFFKDCGLSLPQFKGMRDRITHSYGDIDYAIVKSVLKDHIPELKKNLENIVPKEILENPYSLYDTEYDDIVNSSSSPRTPSFDSKIDYAQSKAAEQIKNNPSKEKDSNHTR